MTMLESMQKGIEEKRCCYCFYFRAAVHGGIGLCDSKVKVVDDMNTCEKWRLDPYSQMIVEELKND